MTLKRQKFGGEPSFTPNTLSYITLFANNKKRLQNVFGQFGRLSEWCNCTTFCHCRGEEHWNKTLFN